MRYYRATAIIIILLNVICIQVLLRTVAGGNHDALEDWLDTASPEGKIKKLVESINI